MVILHLCAFKGQLFDWFIEFDGFSFTMFSFMWFYGGIKYHDQSCYAAGLQQPKFLKAAIVKSIT
jgi:hypothetical protein